MISMQRFAGVLSLILFVVACTGETGDNRRQLGIAGGCDPTLTTCRVSDGDITVSLNIDRRVKALQPFSLRLVLEGAEGEAQSVVADFQMQGMDMGTNRYRLLPRENGWQATVTLPICSASRMDWHAVIEFTLDGEPFLAVFPFHTEAN
jgi:hypothetical protein